MMTELLRHVVSRTEQLPPREQDALAKIIEEELDEREWAVLVATPRSQRFLELMAAKVLAEDEAGLTPESGDAW